MKMDFIPLSSHKQKYNKTHNVGGEKKQPAGKNPRNKYLVVGGDTKLIPRVKQILEENRSQKYIDVEDVTTEFQRRYSEYSRRKRAPLKKAIDNAITYLQSLEKDKISSPESSDDELGYNEEAAMHDVITSLNSVNNTMQDLYAKSPNVKRKSSTSPTELVVKTSCKKKTSKMKKIDNGTISMEASKSEEMKELLMSNDKIEDKQNGTHAENEALGESGVKDANDAVLQKRKKSAKSSETSKKSAITVEKSSVTFADLGGCEANLLEVCKLLFHMKHPEVYETLGVKPPRGFLLHGPPGCGKTLLAHAIAGEFDIPFIKVAATEIVSGVSGESEEKVRELFDKAIGSAPCILFIDEIDAITPKREVAQREMERRIVAQLLCCMDDLNTKNTAMQVLVIGATNRPDSLDPALRRAGRFDHEISMGIPDESARKRILGILCKGLRLASDFDFDIISRNTPGFVGADLMALTREAAMYAVNRTFNMLQKQTTIITTAEETTPSTTATTITTENNNPTETRVVEFSKPGKEDEISGKLTTMLKLLENETALTEDQLTTLYVEMKDFESAIKVVQPSAKREGFATIPNTTWDDIGALKEIREELELSIMAPIKHREECEKLGLTTPTGILLYGPPGCGKTMLAKAIANETGVNFISVKGPELLNMYVGESERAVRQCFQRARNSSPCIIFFDELDSLCPKRSDSSEGTSSARVVNQLLTEMDGLETRKSVYVIGATNRPDIIDPAILRPGRLDKLLYVGLPSPDARVDILKTITKDGTVPSLGPDVDLGSLGSDDRCNLFSGADLAALVKEAAVNALRENLMLVRMSGNKTETIKVSAENFKTALGKLRPSVSVEDVRIYERMQKKFSNH